MRTSVQAIPTVLAAGVFFAAACLAYLCMYLAPTSGLRDWAATRLSLLLLLGPTGFKEVLGAGRIMMLLRQQPALAAVPADRGRRGGAGWGILPAGSSSAMMAKYASGRIPTEFELSEVSRRSETRG